MDSKGSDLKPLPPAPIFRLFTRESMTKITKRIQEEKILMEQKLLLEAEEKAARELNKGRDPGGESEEKKDEDKPRPNPLLEQGAVLPAKMGDFPPEMFGLPIEEIDEYYFNKYTFVVVAKDRTIFRFSSTSGMFLLSPFNPIRRIAIFVLTHPFFSLLVMLVILTNCVFMAINKEIKYTEEIFTGIYTVEGSIKLLARGFILGPFHYLRDAWNWLDFVVVSLAYMTMFIPGLGNLAALRTFRVLRALKTVAVVPGLKTIVGALMEAVRRLRDVMILSLFVLSIFALIGLQIYQGTLQHKCIRDPPDNASLTWFIEALTAYEENTKNLTLRAEIRAYTTNESNWCDREETVDGRICSPGSSGGSKCSEGCRCVISGMNPNYGYTTFDNFGWALLCAFRLMTQDYWENLYQLIIKANGPWHMSFFIVVIFMGSFYLVNLILAIVAMSYDDCQKQDQEAEADELAEENRLMMMELEEDGLLGGGMKKSPSDLSCASIEMYLPRRPAYGTHGDKECLSMKSDCGIDTRRRLSIVNAFGKKSSTSLPGSPFTMPRGSQFNWRRQCQLTPINHRANGGIVAGLTMSSIGLRPNSRRPLVLPCLENLDLPYADDSAAVTPLSDDVCSIQNAQNYLTLQQQQRQQRLSSVTSHGSNRMSQLEIRFSGGGGAGGGAAISRKGSRASRHSRQFPPGTMLAAGLTTSQLDYSGPRLKIQDRKCEPTHFHWATSAKHKALLAASDYNKPKLEESHLEWDTDKEKLFLDNPFICSTPSPTTVDPQDVKVLKDLINHASGKKNFLGFEEGMNKKEFFKAKCNQLLFGWECCPSWYRFSHIIELFIMDAFVDLFITLCIVINTLFMAMEHDGMEPAMDETLKVGNYVFTCIFSVEAALKIVALGLYKYLEDKWSCFDLVIVILSLVELGLSNVKGLSILRSFRLLRVFKLAKSWPTLNLLIGIIGRTMGALGNLCFVLAIIVFIFAVMGMQVFGANYKPENFDGVLPRWHFQDFLHSFMIVFRVLCGEWIESMWDCIHCTSHVCIPFFLLTMIIGNLVVLNLFLALLLSSFGAESLKHTEEEEGPNKLQEAIDRITRFIIYVKSHVLFCFQVYIQRKPPIHLSDYDLAEAAALAYYGTSKHTTSAGHVNAVTDCNSHIGNNSMAAACHDGPTEGGGGVHFGTGNGHVHEVEISPDCHDGPMNSESLQYLHSNEPEEEELHVKIDVKENHVKTIASPLTKLGRRAVTVASASGPSCCDQRHSRFSASSLTSTSSLSDDSTASQRSMLSPSSNCSYSQEDNDSQGKPHDPTANLEIHEVKVVFVKYPDDCCPQSCSAKCGWLDLFDKTLPGRMWASYRFVSFKLVENTYFETFIIIMILTSSLALAVEDKHIDQKLWLKNTLYYMDKSFTIIFLGEMIIKQGAYGFKKYFTDAWCWLDFIIVAISMLSLFAESAGYGNIGAFRALRTLRALRPLRAVSRWEGMKVVVNALIQAIPSIFNVLLVCLVFWLIFSIMGVNLFMGRFKGCIDDQKVLLNCTIITNKTECLANNYTWFNPKINFDNVPNGYLALFQVATFKGWMDIMKNAIDSSEYDAQPCYEIRVFMYLYFVFFIVFGSFFTLNLFIGVIIENFNMQKKKAGGSLEMLMTEDQKKYYNAMKKLGSKQPQKPIPKPKFILQRFVFELVTNQKFDIFIMLVILLNMMTMAIEHYEQPEELEKVLFVINQLFITIFTLECVMKLFALRHYYFKQPWNVFDFVVVISSILGLALDDFVREFMVSPTLLRVVRVFRVGRVLRLVKSAKGIRTLLFSLAVSLPALFNIGLLLFLVMFIYSIFGMSFFMNVRHTYGVDDIFNFETLFHSMIILFQISTSAGWDGVLAALMNEEECNKTAEPPPSGDCGNQGQGVVYIITYLIISFLVVINMYIAVILENFSQATEDVQQGLTQDDFDMYYEIWEQYDMTASQYIPLEKLSEFVDRLEEPLRIPVPNKCRLVLLDIPICEGDRVHCVDILDALTKNFLGTNTDAAGDLGDLKKGPERKDYNPISTTFKRQREYVVAKVIQRTWRNYVSRRRAALNATVITIDDVDAAPNESASAVAVSELPPSYDTLPVTNKEHSLKLPVIAEDG